MKVASTFSPLKYKTSEKISDSIAAVKSNLSVTLNFLNIFIYDYLTHFIGHVICPVFVWYLDSNLIFKCTLF